MFDDYISKPVNPDELLDKIERFTIYTGDEEGA